MQRTFTDEIKYQWKSGGMHIKLIGVNLIVFLFIAILIVFGRLSVTGPYNPVEPIMNEIFTLHATWKGILTHPWGLVTSIFAHFELFHFFFNMLFLYFIAPFFLQYFSNQRMLYTYILGGICGGLFQIIAYSTFPALQGTQTFVVGASASVMAIFMASAFYKPMAEVYFFGIIKVKMIVIALIFILLDLLRMGAMDNVAHFAHLGGIAFGILSIRNVHSRNNIINWTQRTIDNLKKSVKGEPRMKVKKGGGKSKPYDTSSDEDYNRFKKERQKQIDAILDKISKSGYDSLTKKEKQILFDQSNKND
ncbi:MAG: rhomboid family intramembrane serine protease [Brumimicrobium sp.]|nr:rhomboid family intramembrane serine protease [Brumimicrobium sp.]